MVSLTSVIISIESFLKSPEAAFATHLPKALAETIKEYTTGQHDFTKVHEELSQLKKFVSKNNLSESMFLECVALLALKLLSSKQLNQWFNAYVNPAINSASYLNNVAQSARNFFLVILKHGTDSLSDKKLENGTDNPDLFPTTSCIIETPSQLYFYKIYQIYEGSSESFFQFNSEATLNFSERKRFIIQNAKELLIEYGRGQPEQFFTDINKKFLVPENRQLVLILISNILATHKKTDFSKVSNTPFCESLYNCLLYDNSSTILSIGINVMVMFIPYNARNLPFLKLLVIFGRLVAWNALKFPKTELHLESETADFQNNYETSSEHDTANDKIDWKVLNEDHDYSDAKPLDLLPFLSFLYGLFPHNFLEFSRSPSTYLRFMGYCEHVPAIWNDEKVISVVKSFSNKLTLNTFLINFSQEQELNDLDRWNTPAEVLAIHCLNLLLHENSQYDSSTMSIVEDSPEASHYSPSSVITKALAVSSSNKKDNFNFDESPANFAFETALLCQHEQMYRKPENTNFLVKTPTPFVNVPDPLIKQNSAHESSSVPFSLTNLPIEGLNNPQFITQTGTSSGITPITVSNSHQTQHRRKSSDLELLNFSPVTTSSSYSENDLMSDDISMLNSFTKNQFVHCTDPYALLYQKEIFLLKSELDFKSYLMRISYHAYKRQLGLSNTSQNFESENERLKTLVKTLEKKNSNLELASKTVHSDYMTLKLKTDTFIASILKDNKDQKISIKDLNKKLLKTKEDFNTSCKNQIQFFESLAKKQTEISLLEKKLTDLTETLSKLDSYKSLLLKANERLAQIEELKPNFMTSYEEQQAMGALSSLKKFEDSKNAAIFEIKNIKLRSEIERKGYQYQIRHEQEKNVISTKARKSFENFKQEQELANEATEKLKTKLKKTEDEFSLILDELAEKNSTVEQLKLIVDNYEEQIRQLDQKIYDQAGMISKLKQKLIECKKRFDWQNPDLSNIHPGRGGFQNSSVKRKSTVD